MAIHVPADAKVVRDSRINVVQIIKALYDRFVDNDDSVKSKIKSTLQEKKADYAETEICVAALRAGTPRSSIDTNRAFKMFLSKEQSKELSLAQFLSCATVSKKALEKFLSGDEIAKLSVTGGAAEPALYIEFKPGVQVNLDEIATTIAGMVAPKS